MKRVITYGTFDLLHYGHINLLRRAKAYGDYLIVALSTDEFNWNEKHKKCYFSYEKRKSLLEAIRYVDLVIPEENWNGRISGSMDIYHSNTNDLLLSMTIPTLTGFNSTYANVGKTKNVSVCPRRK